MHLTKIIAPDDAAPLADLPFGIKMRARAWTEEGGTIYVLASSQTAVRLLCHEVAHALRNEDNEQLHHPWWHFCGLVGHALRILWPLHLTAAEVRAGQLLAEHPAGYWVVA